MSPVKRLDNNRYLNAELAGCLGLTDISKELELMTSDVARNMYYTTHGEDAKNHIRVQTTKGNPHTYSPP